MNFTVDSSFALAWVFEDEATAQCDKVFERFGAGATAIVPSPWRWEIGNALLIAERRKRITAAEIREHFNFLLTLPIDINGHSVEQAWSETHRLAQQHKLTSYDAAYLELTIRRGLPLASRDADLRAAAQAEKVRLL